MGGGFISQKSEKIFICLMRFNVQEKDLEMYF